MSLTGEQYNLESSHDDYDIRDFEDHMETHDCDTVYSDPPDDESEDNKTAFSLVENNKKNKIKDKKKDPGYKKLKMKDGGSITYFTTNCIPGAPVRDPMYGHYDYSVKVGTSDEDSYFKVVNWSVGTDSKDTDFLYYNSPDYFERHFNISLSDDIKKRWYNKSIKTV